MFEYGEIGSSVILVVTIAISLAGLYGSPKIIEKCLFRPYYFLRRKEYDTIYLSGFVHADLQHLAFNMITFYFFAFALEFRIGTVPFLILYVVGLIASHGCTYYKHKDNPQYASLGASGAVMAVVFAYIVFYPTSTILLFLAIPVPAVLLAIGYLAYSYWASTQARGRVNHDAHLCGAISGLLFVAVMDPGAFARLPQAFG